MIGTPSHADYEDLAQAEKRQRILTDVTSVFLDYVGNDEVEPLRRVAEMLALALDNWCAFSLVQADGVLKQVVAWHPDPSQRALAERLEAVVPPQRWNEWPPEANVFTLGKPVVFNEITEDMVRQEDTSEEAFALYSQIQLRSIIMAPMRIGPNPLGVLTLASAGAAKHEYGTRDVDLVSAISSRASLAVRNARLALALSRERDEAERQASELGTILAADPNGLALFGPDDRLRYTNPRLSELLSFPLERLAGEHYSELTLGGAGMALGDAAPAFCDFERLFPARDARSTDEITLDEPVRRIMERVTVPVTGPNGAYYGRLFLFTDVTRSHMVDRERREFLTVAAHELRTPLTPISMHLQSMERLLASSRPIEPALVAKSRRQLARLAELTDDLLNLSRLETGRLEIHREPLALDDLVAQVAREFPIPNAMHDVVVRIQERGLTVLADGLRIEQVLTNLLQNAAKYSPHGGRIVVELDRVGMDARVSVRDSGIGIPEEEQGHLFERFFRARNAKTAHFGGLGIGLFISHAIIEHHRGRFEVESSDGNGSTFSFFLPLFPPAAHGQTTDRRRILVVEDDAAILDATSAFLEEAGYTAEPALNSSMALNLLRKCSYDLLIVDLMLPGMDGGSFIEQVRREALAPRTPIVVVSADHATETKAAQLRASAWLRKPTNLDQLETVIGRLLPEGGSGRSAYAAQLN